MKTKTSLLALLALVVLLPYPSFGKQLKEPPELSGPDKKVEELPKEQKQAVMDMLPAFQLLRNEKDAQKIKEAIDKLSDLIKSNPEYSDLYYLRAMIAFHFQGSKDYRKIIEDIDNAIKFYPSTKYTSAYESNASKYSMRAKVNKDAGDYQQAMKDMEMAVNIGPNEFDVIGSSNPDPDDPPAEGTWGKRDFDDIIQKFPRDFRGYMFRGLYYDCFTRFDGKNYALAISDYRKAISLNPKSAVCHYLLGKAISKRIWWNPKVKTSEDYQKEYRATMAGLSVYSVYPQEYKDIITELSEAIRLNPQMVDAYRQRAQTYLTAREYKLAVKDYDKIIELDPDYGGAYHDRAIACQELGNHHGAIDSYSKAIEAKKQITAPYSAYEGRAKAYIKVHDYRNATNDFTKAIELQIGNFVLLMSISQFRRAYPEYNGVSDESLARKLHKKFYPDLKYEDFRKRFLKENKEFASSIVPELYVERGDAYLNWGYYKKALEDYNRVKAFPDYAKYFDEWERWRPFSESSEGKFYLDIKTITYPQKDTLRFWAKMEYNKTQENKVKYSIRNWEVNCPSRMVRGISLIDYDSDGNVTNQWTGTKWQHVVPDSVGETFFKGFCGETRAKK